MVQYLTGILLQGIGEVTMTSPSASEPIDRIIFSPSSLLASSLSSLATTDEF